VLVQYRSVLDAAALHGKLQRQNLSVERLNSSTGSVTAAVTIASAINHVLHSLATVHSDRSTYARHCARICEHRDRANSA
jgi:hypothetical protein